jgi:hypothetical protein
MRRFSSCSSTLIVLVFWRIHTFSLPACITCNSHTFLSLHLDSNGFLFERRGNAAVVYKYPLASPHNGKRLHNRLMNIFLYYLGCFFSLECYSILFRHSFWMWEYEECIFFLGHVYFISHESWCHPFLLGLQSMAVPLSILLGSVWYSCGF